MFSFSCVCIFTFKESVKFSRSLVRECLASNPLRHCSISKENEVSGTECPIISEKNSLEQKYEKYVMVSYSAIFIALAQVFKKFTAIKKLKNSCLFLCILKLWLFVFYMVLMNLPGIGEGQYHNCYVWCTKQKPSVHH